VVEKHERAARQEGVGPLILHLQEGALDVGPRRDVIRSEDDPYRARDLAYCSLDELQPVVVSTI